MMRRMSKRASISVGIMVIVTILLFIFIVVLLNYNSSQISGRFNEINSLEKVYAQQQGYENTIYFRLVGVFLDSYQAVLKENAEKIVKEKADFNEMITVRVMSDFKNNPADDHVNKMLADLFNSINYFVFDGENFSVSRTLWEVEKNLTTDNSAKIIYSSNLESSVSLAMFGLPSFDYINKSYSGCVKEADKDKIRSCFEQKFPTFSVGLFNTAVTLAPVSESSGNTYNSGGINVVQVTSEEVSLEGFSITFVSKDKYYLNNEMKNIEFSFKFIRSTPKSNS